jgi:predicted transposase YdaD
VIITANFAVAKEAARMTNTFERFMEETGLAAKAEARGRAEGEARGEVRGRAEGEARGEARGMEKVARNALAQGATPEFVQKITGLDIQTITGYK